jgi:hypothetical protein
MRIHRFILPSLTLVCAVIGGFLLGMWSLARQPLVSATPPLPSLIPSHSPCLSPPPGMATESDPNPYRIETPVAIPINEHVTWVLTGLGDGYQSWLLNSSTSQATVLRGSEVMRGLISPLRRKMVYSLSPFEPTGQGIPLTTLMRRVGNTCSQSQEPWVIRLLFLNVAIRSWP